MPRVESYLNYFHYIAGKANNRKFGGDSINALDTLRQEESDMTRIAKCHCEALKVSCEGEPKGTTMCHCEFCQRRTGSSFNIGTWFKEENVTVTGETKEYVRVGEQGVTITFHFCPTCGSNVYWEFPEYFPGQTGVAVGCFTDSEFPAPNMSFYGKRRHKWVTLPSDMPSFLEGGGSEQE